MSLHRPAAPRRRRHIRRGTAGAAFVALSALLASCGVNIDAAPHTIDHAPFGLLKPATPTTGTTPVGQYVTMYLAGPKRLAAVSRPLPSPLTLPAVLNALGQGPTATQAADGLESPLSTAAPLTLVKVKKTRVTVNMSTSFTKLTETDQAIAMAQLVYTVTSLPGIISVEVHIHGKRAKVPTGKGTLSGAPLVRADYATLAPL